MQPINCVSCRVEKDGQFLTLVDFWQPKGTIELRHSEYTPRKAVIVIGGTQAAIGDDCTHFTVS